MTADPRPDDLLRRARARSPVALDALAIRLRRDLRPVLERRVGTGLRRYVSVSDLEQDVLGELRDALEQLPEEAGYDDLLRLVLHRTSWAIGRALRNTERLLGESAAQEAAPGEDPGETGAVTRADEFAYFESLVASLPPELAEVVWLRREGRTFGEIGAVMGIGEEAARKRFLRAARGLRDQRGPVSD